MKGDRGSAAFHAERLCLSARAITSRRLCLRRKHYFDNGLAEDETQQLALLSRLRRLNASATIKHFGYQDFCDKKQGNWQKMSEEQSSYKVTDRRLFNADGTPREMPAEQVSEDKPSGPAPTTPEPTVEASAVDTSPAPENDVADESSADDLIDADDPASFASFMMSIASNAASALGMMEHPVTHKREVDLELGKHWIDVLGMLQQKTRGNLVQQEQQLLEGLLSDLRMQYVSLTNTTTQPRQFSSRDITGG